MIIGITGVFGSGKTTVARLFAKQGYKVVNADVIGHKLLNGKRVRDKVVKVFGKSVLSKGKIDRRKLKDIVFYNHRSLVKLNEIVHPLIIKDIKSIVKKSKNKNIVIDAALLIEAKALNLVDKLIVVKIDRKEHLNRVLRKGKYTKKEIESIVKSQLSQKEKLKYGDMVIDNSRRLDDTKKAVRRIIKELR